MRPLYLAISGINSFVDRQEVFFEKSTGLFCISGATGSGKTTLLDSIVLALYGKGNRGRLSDYINLSQNQADITLEFEAEGTVYQIERTIYRDKPSKCLLTDKTSSKVLADQVSAADQKVKSIIGLQREEFTQVALIEQGRFSEFLSADKATRNATVGNLFRLDKFKNLYEKFNSKKSILAERLSTLTEQNKDYQAITDQFITELETQEAAQKSELENTQKQLSSCEEEYQSQCKNKLEYDIITQSKQKLATTSQSFEEISSKLTALENKLKDIDKYADEAQARHDAAEKNKLLVGALDQLKNTSTLRQSLLKKKETLTARLKKFNDEQAQNQQQVDAYTQRIAKIALTATSDLESASKIYHLEADFSHDYTQCFVAQSVENDDSCELQTRCAATLSSLVQNASSIKSGRQRLTAQIQESQQTLANLKETSDAFTEVWKQGSKQSSELLEQISALEHEESQLKIQLKQAQISDTAGYLRSGLAVGDECPVCGGVLSKIVAQSECESDAIQGKLTELQTEIESKRQQLHKVTNANALASLKLGNAQEQSTRTEALLSSSRTELAELLKHVKEADSLPRFLEILDNLSSHLAQSQRLWAMLRELSAKGALAKESMAAAISDLEHLDKEIAELTAAIEQKTCGEDLSQMLKATQDKIKEDTDFVERFKKAREQTEQEIRQATNQKSHLEGEIKTIKESADKQILFDPAAFLQLEKSKLDLAKTKSDLDSKLLKIGYQITDAKEKLQKKQSLESQIKQITTKTDTLSLILKIVKGDRFLEFVAEEYIIRFTYAASEILAKITSGKYTLEYQDGIFYVKDFLMEGRLRRASTLSGGETFLAALALAMAITSEISGYKSFEFFFLDEGFGTLDSDSIEIVYEALETLSKETLVGIVTHRGELVDKIPAQIKITPATEKEGSRITQTF